MRNGFYSVLDDRKGSGQDYPGIEIWERTRRVQRFPIPVPTGTVPRVSPRPDPLGGSCASNDTWDDAFPIDFGQNLPPFPNHLLHATMHGVHAPGRNPKCG